jgi:hypothetical protein
MDTNKSNYPLAVVQAMQTVNGHENHFFCEERDRVSGWVYKSEFELTLCDRKVIFRVYTSKRDGFIVSTLTGHRLSPTGSMVHVMSFGHQGDFSKTILRESNVRATRALLLSKHVDAIAMTGTLGASLKAHYTEFFADKVMTEVMEYL